MKRLAGLLIFVPLGIVVVALAVANRQSVVVSIPPQVGDGPLYSFSLPLFALLFLTLFFGMLIGSFATWLSQARHRRQARHQKQQADKMTTEANKQAERAEALDNTANEEQKALNALGLAPPSKAA